MMKTKDTLTKVDFISAFKQYGSLIYKYTYLRVNKRKEIAEDLTQATFVKAFKNRFRFDKAKSSIKTWLFVIARHTIIDFYRTNRDIKTVTSEEEVEGENFVDELERQDLAKFVLGKIDLLKKEEKELLILRYIEDLTLDEVSKVIDKKKSATKVSIHRALKKLKELVNGRT